MILREQLRSGVLSVSEDANSSVDKLKPVLAVLILVSSVAFYYSFAELSVLIRVGGVLLGVVLSAFVMLQSEKGKRLWLFAQEARTEVRKVVWPTRAETIQTTLIVLVMVAIVSIMLWCIDMLLFWAVKFITGQGG
jgi:preprotein translocase subunit SecE